jgi:hypothetical protein
MKETITKIQRERGYTYRVDKQGNVIKETYNWFKDPFTLVTIAVIILAGFYYMQQQESITNTKNFPEACNLYTQLKTQWLIENPNQPLPELKELLSYSIGPDNQIRYNEKDFISP